MHVHLPPACRLSACPLSPLYCAPLQEEAASAINAALAHAFTHSHQQRWLELAAAALELPQFAAAHAAAHEAAAAATVAGGNFGAGAARQKFAERRGRRGVQGSSASGLPLPMRPSCPHTPRCRLGGAMLTAQQVGHAAARVNPDRGAALPGWAAG